MRTRMVPKEMKTKEKMFYVHLEIIIAGLFKALALIRIRPDFSGHECSIRKRQMVILDIPTAAV